MPNISDRAQTLLDASKGQPLQNALFRTFANQYDPDHAPEGIINAGIAENSLMSKWLREFFNTHLKLEKTDLTYGASLVGSPRLVTALIPFYERYFKPHKPLKTEHIIVGNGLSSILDHSSAVMANPGDAYILARPFYNAFEQEFGNRSQVDIVGVVIPEGEHGQRGEIEAFEREMQRQSRSGQASKIKAVLVTNPYNPLGFSYSKELLLEYCRFAERHDLWLIVDEIYATSVYASDIDVKTPFTSILSLDVQAEAQCNPGRIVQMYGASKDFGANGLRLGVLVTHNEALYSGMMSLAFTLKPSSAADALWSALLNSPQHLGYFIEESQRRLAEAYLRATTWLKGHQIPYRPAEAGHFIWINLRHLLDLNPEPPFGDLESSELQNREWELLTELLDAGVYLGPGQGYHSTAVGMFRLTFSIPREDLEVALDRMGKVIQNRRNQIDTRYHTQ